MIPVEISNTRFFVLYNILQIHIHYYDLNIPTKILQSFFRFFFRYEALLSLDRSIVNIFGRINMGS